MNHNRRLFLARSLAALPLTGIAGCQLLGLFGSALPPPTVAARYKGLRKQTVGVMVWTDRAMAVEWPALQLNLTQSIQSRLQDLAKSKGAPAELDGTTFVAAESVVRYQRDHPETEFESITDIAPHMALTRLIYVEVQEFETRPSESLDLYRGRLTGNLKVIETTGARAKVAYEESNLSVIYPASSPEEGMPGIGDGPVYENIVRDFTTEVVNRFVPHQEERK